MGIFNDLGFKNRNEVLVAPDSERLGGKDIAGIRGEMSPPVLVEDTDSVVIITSFPHTITRESVQDKWIAVIVEATGLSTDGVVKINEIDVALNTQQIVNASSLALTVVGSATSIKITPYVLN